MNKVKYLLRILSSQNQKVICPTCKSLNYIQIDQKLLGITKLVECTACKLRYRIPQESEDFKMSFYQSSYEQGVATNLPSDEELKEFKKSNFSMFCYSATFLKRFLHSISNHLGRKIKIFDHGANWGYKAYEFQSFDFVDSVTCYELSKPRRTFGENKLNIKYIDKLEDIDEEFDLFFSSHVIEHMHNPLEIKSWANKILCNNGVLLITCPNGSDQSRLNKNWSKLWGEVHPNFISDEFICQNFSEYNGSIFDESLINDPTCIPKLLVNKISTLRPESSNLWFIGQKRI